VIDLDALRRETADLSSSSLIEWAAATYGSAGVAFASSLGAEDQVITHMISGLSAGVPVFTLDTGRLFAETYDLLDVTRKRYGMDISVYFPDAGRVEQMVRSRGPNLFYESVENRKLCCHVRKVEPLERALSGLKAWIVGLREEQAVTRQGMSRIDWDEKNGLVRISPLADWSEDRVWEFIREHDVPYHRLHDSGFRSIGCAPCTRAVGNGEDARAGRWWWEDPHHKECGLHAGDPQFEPSATGRQSDRSAAGDGSTPFGIQRLNS